MELKIKERSIPYQDAFELYKSLTDYGRVPALLMESRTINLAYGKQSIIAASPALKVSGKNEDFQIDALTEQGVNLLREFSGKDFPFAISYHQDDRHIGGTFERGFDANLTEDESIKKTSAASFLKGVLGKFQTDNKYAGLYGAFAYDFARNFEDFGHRHDKKPGDDFSLFFPGEIYVFDDVKERGVHYEINIGGSKDPFKIHELEMNHGGVPYDSMSEAEFMDKTKSIIADIKNGRFMQCVLSRSKSVPLTKNPIFSYEHLREANPSPYCYFFNFGEGEYLYGSSPEIHVTVENREMVIRPLAGTKRRSKCPVEDANARIELQKDKKERSEHIMLVDLARNEAYRICYPESVEVTDLLTVEYYPNLYHLASGVKGNLKFGMDSIDAILTTLPAGTLSGAPKLEAMKVIEELENTRRGFYGGVVGYLAFNGDCNTGINIRSAHVKDGFSTVQAGAGIVVKSNPEDEFDETKLKMSKPLEAILK